MREHRGTHEMENRFQIPLLHHILDLAACEHLCKIHHVHFAMKVLESSVLESNCHFDTRWLIYMNLYCSQTCIVLFSQQLRLELRAVIFVLFYTIHFVRIHTQ